MAELCVDYEQSHFYNAVSVVQAEPTLDVLRNEVTSDHQGKIKNV